MGAIDRATRRRIFYLLALAFAVVTPLAILYSQGYVFDLRQRELVATGGIFVKTLQSGVRVSVDSEFQRETSFISRGTLIVNLVPRRYTVRAEKDGFQRWEKVVRVADGEVLEFRNVLLPPATITPQLLSTAPEGVALRLWTLAGRPEIVLEVGEPARPFTLAVIDPETGRSRFSVSRVTAWFWDQNAGVIVATRIVEDRVRWYRVPVTGETSPERIVFRGLPPGFAADSVSPHPTNPGEFYFLAGGALFLQGRANVPVPIAEQVHAFSVTPERIYFVSRNGFFVESNLAGGEIRVLGRKGLFLDDAQPARVLPAPGGEVAVFDSAGGLFVFRPDRDQELGFVAGNVRALDFDERGERMLFWDDHRLAVYWFRDNPRQPFDLAGTRREIFASQEPVTAAFLAGGGAHVLFATERAIRMVETDTRGGANVYEFISGPIGSFAFDRGAGRLYWGEGPRVFRAALP